MSDSVRIDGPGDNSLEIGVVSGDFMITVTTFDTSVGRQTLTAQFPNPRNGGGIKRHMLKSNKYMICFKNHQKPEKNSEKAGFNNTSCANSRGILVT